MTDENTTTYFTPETGRALIDDAYRICLEEHRTNPMPPSLKAMFNAQASGTTLARAKEIIFDLLPQHPALFDKFVSERRSKDMMALSLLALNEGKNDLFESWISRVEVDPKSRGYVRSLLAEFRNGYSDKINRMAERAAAIIFETFEIEDYAALSEPQQQMLVRLFDRYDWGYERSDAAKIAHARLVQGLHIPSGIIQFHEEKMEELSRKILTDDDCATLYKRIFDPRNFRDEDEAARTEIAGTHVGYLSEIYGVEAPELEIIDEPEKDDGEGNTLFLNMQMAIRTEVDGIFGDVINLTPIIRMNKAKPLYGLFETMSRTFVDMLSHEFGHYLESLLVFSLPDIRYDLHLREAGLERFPEMHKDSDMMSVANIFNINSSGLHGTANYIDAENDSAAYTRQVKERHADWLGALCASTISKTLETRDYIEDPESYRKQLDNTLKLTATELAPYQHEFLPLIKDINDIRIALAEAKPDDIDGVLQKTHEMLELTYMVAQDFWEDQPIPSPAQKALEKPILRLRTMYNNSARVLAAKHIIDNKDMAADNVTPSFRQRIHCHPS